MNVINSGISSSIAASFNSAANPLNSANKPQQDTRRNNQTSTDRSSESAANNVTFNASQTDRVRVIRVAKDNIEIQEFGAGRADRNENATSRNSPTAQYQSNESLLQRQSIEESIGIDVFA